MTNLEQSLLSAIPKNAPLGLPLLGFMQKDPLAAASCFKAHFGDVAKLSILFRQIYYFYNPEAVR